MWRRLRQLDDDPGLHPGVHAGLSVGGLKDDDLKNGGIAGIVQRPPTPEPFHQAKQSPSTIHNL